MLQKTDDDSEAHSVRTRQQRVNETAVLREERLFLSVRLIGNARVTPRNQAQVN